MDSQITIPAQPDPLSAAPTAPPVAAAAVPAERRTLTGELRLVAMLVGMAAGAAIAWSSPDRPRLDVAESGWVFFAVVAGLLGAAGGEAFAFGWARWRDLVRDHDVRLWHAVPLVLAALAVAGGLTYATPYILGDKAMTGRGVAVSALAVVGALPAAAALAAVQRITRRPLPGGAGDQLCVLLGLRRLTSRLLNQLGLLVLLVTMVNGAATGWGAELPKTVVVFSGAVASFVVGVMYVPAATTLRRRSSLYVDRYFPLKDVPISGLVAAAEDRGKLEKLLGTDRTTFDELKAGLVILTPFVVSALAALVPRL